MLLRRWPNIESPLGQCLVFAGIDMVSQQTQNMCITFVQRRPNVKDVGPTLFKCYTNAL